MIRVYDEVMGKILTILAYVRVRDGKQDLRTIAGKVLDYGAARWGSGDGVDEIATGEIQHWANNTRDRQTVDELLNDLGKQSLQRRAISIDGDQTLIDKIVDTLKLDLAAPVLTGRSLSRLRDAILFPAEIAQVTKRLTSRTVSCKGCQRDIHDGEATTALTDDRGIMFLHCYNCQRPTVVKCAHPDCEQLIEIKNKSRFLQKFLCEFHFSIKPEREDPTPTLAVPDFRDLFQRAQVTRETTRHLAGGMAFNPPGVIDDFPPPEAVPFHRFEEDEIDPE